MIFVEDLRVEKVLFEIKVTKKRKREKGSAKI